MRISSIGSFNVESLVKLGELGKLNSFLGMDVGIVLLLDTLRECLNALAEDIVLDRRICDLVTTFRVLEDVSVVGVGGGDDDDEEVVDEVEEFRFDFILWDMQILDRLDGNTVLLVVGNDVSLLLLLLEVLSSCLLECFDSLFLK